MIVGDFEQQQQQQWRVLTLFDVKRFTKLKLFASSLDGDLEGVVDALAQGGTVAMRN